MKLEIRPATPADASGMKTLLNEIIAIGGTTAHRHPFDDAGIVRHFISQPLRISCFVAVEAEQVLGFQALDWADSDWPDAYRLPADWAIIATFVDRRAHRKGAGKALFAKTLGAAQAAGVHVIDATIRKVNTGGLAFYRGLGFVDYRESAERFSTRFAVRD